MHLNIQILVHFDGVHVLPIWTQNFDESAAPYKRLISSMQEAQHSSPVKWLRNESKH
jgi:hypothetical protein